MRRRLSIRKRHGWKEIAADIRFAFSYWEKDCQGHDGGLRVYHVRKRRDFILAFLKEAAEECIGAEAAKTE